MNIVCQSTVRFHHESHSCAHSPVDATKSCTLGLESDHVFISWGHHCNGDIDPVISEQQQRGH